VIVLAVGTYAHGIHFRQALLTDLQVNPRPTPGKAVASGAYEFRPGYESPAVPSGLNAMAVSPVQINLAWTASTDNTRPTRKRFLMLKL
jgi:hypothetical protein